MPGILWLASCHLQNNLMRSDNPGLEDEKIWSLGGKLKLAQGFKALRVSQWRVRVLHEYCRLMGESLATVPECLNAAKDGCWGLV